MSMEPKGWVICTDAREQGPIIIIPGKVRGLLAVDNGRNTRITYWDGNSRLVEGTIHRVAEHLFGSKKDQGTTVTALQQKERTCFDW